MTGSPLLRVLFLVAAFCLALVPLVHLTTGPPPVQTAPDQSAAAVEPGTVAAILRVRFASTPDRLTIRQGDTTWLDLTKPDTSPVEADVRFTPSPDGAEITVSATWPEGTAETAIGLELEPDGLDTQRQSLWTETGTMDEIALFRWK